MLPSLHKVISVLLLLLLSLLLLLLLLLLFLLLLLLLLLLLANVALAFKLDSPCSHFFAASLLSLHRQLLSSLPLLSTSCGTNKASLLCFTFPSLQRKPLQQLTSKITATTKRQNIYIQKQRHLVHTSYIIMLLYG